MPATGSGRDPRQGRVRRFITRDRNGPGVVRADPAGRRRVSVDRAGGIGRVRDLPRCQPERHLSICGTIGYGRARTFARVSAPGLDIEHAYSGRPAAPARGPAARCPVP